MQSAGLFQLLRRFGGKAAKGDKAAAINPPGRLIKKHPGTQIKNSGRPTESRSLVRQLGSSRTTL